MLKKLPLGIQTFSKLQEENCLYVDKTEHIYQLIKGYCYFLTRPRRFGKSILCSTLVALFQGKKELFTALWITKNTDYAWPIHPVLHIDFNQISIETPGEFKQDLMHYLNNIALAENLAPLLMISPVNMLQVLINKLKAKYNGKNVVLIIDEYDRPILHHLTETHLFPLAEYPESFKTGDECLPLGTETKSEVFL